jgi:hypothetical protein
MIPTPHGSGLSGFLRKTTCRGRAPLHIPILTSHTGSVNPRAKKSWRGELLSSIRLCQPSLGISTLPVNHLGDPGICQVCPCVANRCVPNANYYIIAQIDFIYPNYSFCIYGRLAGSRRGHGAIRACAGGDSLGSNRGQKRSAAKEVESQMSSTTPGLRHCPVITTGLAPPPRRRRLWA